MQTSPAHSRRGQIAAGLLAWSAFALSGCGLSVTNPAFYASPSAPAAVTTSSSNPIHGRVGGRQWSVSGSKIQLYAVGTQGTKSSATPLLSAPAATDSSGDFTISGSYTCPSPAAQLYLLATGGNPGLAAGTDNDALALMTVLGPCNGLSATTMYPVNEVTTIGSIWPLSPFMSAATNVGSGPSDPSFTTAMSHVSQLINLGEGLSPGTGVPTGYAVQTAKLDTLADDLHACILSAGGTAGDGSLCGQLFSLATAPGSAPAMTTVDAALSLAQNNQLNVDALYRFTPQNSPYQPVLPDAPSDWDLDLVQIPAAPVITPATGTYPAGQPIDITSNTTGANIRYSLDGSVPSATSLLYNAPLALSASETLHAASFIEDIGSLATTATFTLSSQPTVVVTPLTTTLSSSQTQQFVATVTGSSNTGITWTVTPALGTVSPAGLYTAPASITTPATVTVTATTTAQPAKQAAAVINLITSPAVNISVAPGSVNLAPAQTQLFTASVTGTSNTAVTWALTPALGTISAVGLYTAPASITTSSTVTVSATTTTQPAKQATATVVLTPSSNMNISINVAPGSVNLAPAQTQLFTASITGTSNSAVTWSLAPDVGTITSAGLYTAPASVNAVEDITVTATSNADPAKAASATISITPNGPASTTYYLDNVEGSDSNTGTSEAAPLATIAKVNSLNFLPGQTVAFKAGDVWHETLVVSQSGSAGAPLRYTSYGNGNQPVIDASDNVTGWTSGGADLPAYVWSHPQTTDPLLINFSGTAGVPVSSKTTISQPYQFAWDGSTLYVYSTSDPTTTVEIEARISALASGSAAYVTVSNLELRGGRDTVYCNGAGPCANWDFEGNTIDSAGGVGLRWLPNPGSNGGNLTVNHNTIRGTGGAGIGVSNGGPNMGDMISNNTVTDACKIFIAGSPENSYCDGINAYSATGTDGGGEIVNNMVSQVGLASRAAYGGGIHADTVVNWDIEHNTITNTNYPGIALEKGSGSTARYNLLVNTGQYPYFSGLFIRAGDGLNVTDMLAEYNTVVGGFWACALSIWPNQGVVTATNITMSENICTGSQSGTQLWLDPGFANTGNTFSSNGFGAPSAAFVTANNIAYGIYSLLPGPISGSIAGDPQFVAPGGGNYTLEPGSPDLTIGAFPQP